jgi:mRNA-degrading endonuclease YafQ of YafQ-DinJ toxin-antitoxin module
MSLLSEPSKNVFKATMSLERKFRTKLEKFQENPFVPSLETHKLSGKLKELWSFTIEYSQRVIFYFTDDEKAVFVDIGNHDQVY